MSEMQKALANVGTSDRDGNVIAPHVFARRLRAHTDRARRATNTIIASAADQEASAS